MSPKIRVGLPLSPIALATLVTLAAMQTPVSVPWVFPMPAEANHCAPPCDCVCVCDCFFCDGGSMYVPDPPEETCS